MKQLAFVDTHNNKTIEFPIFFTLEFSDLLGMQQVEDNCEVLWIIKSYMVYLELSKDIIADNIIKIAFYLLDPKLHMTLI